MSQLTGMLPFSPKRLYVRLTFNAVGGCSEKQGWAEDRLGMVDVAILSVVSNTLLVFQMIS